MGSSDPLPAGFEIRFGSLNFQATGNGHLMPITNHDMLHPWRSTGPGSVPVAPAADAPAPAQADAEHLNADDAPVSTLDTRGRNDDEPRVLPCNVTRSLTRRQPLQRGGGVRFPGRGSPSAFAAPQWRTPHPPAPTWRHAEVVLAAMPQPLGTSPQPPTASPTTAPPASYHPPLRTRTRNGRAGPSDVPAVPRRRGLLVRLLRQLQHRELRPRAGMLRRDRQRPSKRRKRDGSWRRRGSPKPGNWTAPGCGAKRASPLTAEGFRHQRVAGPSARARGQTRGGVPRGAATSCLHRWGSLCAWRTHARAGQANPQAHQRRLRN
jgi:hypothetical protein